MPDNRVAGAPDADYRASAPDAASEGQTAKPEKHYDIDIFDAWCKECGICAALCPRGCISLDEEGKPVVTDAARCTGCRWCELHCPDFAIRVREQQATGSGEEAD